MVGYSSWKISSIVSIMLGIIINNSMVIATTLTTTIFDGSTEICSCQSFPKSSPCIYRFTSKWKEWKFKRRIKKEKYLEKIFLGLQKVCGKNKIKENIFWFLLEMKNAEWKGYGGSLISPVDLNHLSTKKWRKYYSKNTLIYKGIYALNCKLDSYKEINGEPLYDGNVGRNTFIGVFFMRIGSPHQDFSKVYAKILNKNRRNPTPDFCSINLSTHNKKQEPTIISFRTLSMISTLASDKTSKKHAFGSNNNYYIICNENESEVEVIIELDQYPFETNWRITDLSGKIEVEGGNYEEIFGTKISKTCLSNSVQYIFTINDNYGDGFTSYGSYILRWNGDLIVHRKGNFGSYETHNFGEQFRERCGWINNTQMKELKLKFRTDNNGRETFYEVQKRNIIIYDGGFDYYFSPNKTYEHKFCLPDDCYTLHFYDEFGDGICCEHNYGKYSLYYDGKKVRSSNFRDGYEQVTPFGNCS